MNTRLAHRGPDASGVHVHGPMGLAHSRLSIIDISHEGNQPMSDSRGRYWIVFNGEIYNFKGLRKELEALGSTFQTKTDTEVIIEAYRHWKEKCLERFNGMFAFALWDSAGQKLFLARDRLGKKPLYYKLLDDGGVVFASELKALAEDPDVDFKLNPAAVRQFISTNYTFSSQCIVKGVSKLEAAHYLVVEKDAPMKTACYWDLAGFFHNKSDFTSEEQASEELNRILDDSVRLRMISDVPLGAFLSGGIDSSSIVSAMTRLVPPDNTHTFSIGFNERSYSELPEAREVSDELKVVHRDKVVDADMARILPEIVRFADEPFADTSMIPTYFLAQFSRQHVTVCLSGDGGDEIFAGYETYAADKIHKYLKVLPGWMISPANSVFSRFWPVSFDKVSFDYKVRQFLGGHGLDHCGAHFWWRQIFSDSEQRELLAPSLYAQMRDYDPCDDFRKYDAHVEGCDYLDRSMYVDIKTWLVDDILVKVDRMTMAHSLEARAPFLDYRMVEYAASLPINLKMKGFEKKYILKKSQQRYLPAGVLNRKKKGFNAPVSHWLNNTLSLFVDRIVNQEGPASEVFNTRVVAELMEQHAAGRRDNSLKLFSIITLALWMEAFLN